MTSIFDWWRQRYPDQAEYTDAQLGIAILTKDPDAWRSHPELNQYRDSYQRIKDRENGAAFDRQTVQGFQQAMEKPEEERGIFGTLLKDPAKRGILMSKQADIVTSFSGVNKEFTVDDARNLIEIRKELEDLEVSDEFREFQEADGFIKSWGEFWGLKETPYIIGEVVTESMAALLHNGWKNVAGGAATGAATGAAAGAIGGPLAGATAGVGALWGAAGGVGKTSYDLSASSKFLETIEATVGRNVMDDPEALFNSLNDPETLKKARSKAAKYGIPIAMFDTLSMGLAGRGVNAGVRIANAAGSRAKVMVGKEGLLNNAARIGLLGTQKAAPMAAPLAFQSTLGASGEFFGQLSSEGKINDWKSVFLEGIAEFGMAPLEIGAANLTKDMSADHSKALNGIIRDRRKAGVDADSIKAETQKLVNSGYYTQLQGDVINTHVDEVFESEAQGKTPPSEMGAMGRMSKADANRALNMWMGDRGYGPPVRPSQQVGESESQRRGTDYIIGKRSSINKYRSALKGGDEKTADELRNKTLEEGGVEIENDASLLTKGKEVEKKLADKGYVIQGLNPQAAFEKGEQRLAEARAAQLEALSEIKSWKDITKYQNLSELDGDKAEELIKNLNDGLAEYNTFDETAVAVVNDPFWQDNLTADETNAIVTIGDHLENEALKGIAKKVTPASEDDTVAFARRRKGDPNQGDLFAPETPEDSGEGGGFYSLPAELFPNELRPTEEEMGQIGDPATQQDAMFEEFPEALDKPQAKRSVRRVGKRGDAQIPDQGIFGGQPQFAREYGGEGDIRGLEQRIGKQVMSTDPAESSERELLGFTQGKRPEREDLVLEQELEISPDELNKLLTGNLHTKSMAEDNQMKGRQPHPLLQKLESKDFPISIYGSWGIESNNWGKRWNAIDPQTGAIEKINYFEGARRSALKLAAGNVREFGDEAYDMAYDALHGFNTYAQGTTTEEGRVQFRAGMIEELRRRAEEVMDNEISRGATPEQAALSPDIMRVARTKAPISGAAILKRNFLDQVRARRREEARIESVKGGQSTKGKRLSEQERKRRSKKQIRVAGGESRNIAGGVTASRTASEFSEGSMTGWDDLREEGGFRADITGEAETDSRYPDIIFDGEEFVEAEAGVEGADLTKLDLAIEEYHSGSAEMSGMGSKKIRAMEATKIAVRSFLSDFRKRLHEDESPESLSGWKDQPWWHYSRVNQDIYTKVIIPEFANRVDWRMKAQKDRPKVESDLYQLKEEAIQIRKKIDELNGKRFKQHVRRLVLSEMMNLRELGPEISPNRYSELGKESKGKFAEALNWISQNLSTPESPKWSGYFIKWSDDAIKAQFEGFEENNVVASEANTKIKVKMGGIGTGPQIGGGFVSLDPETGGNVIKGQPFQWGIRRGNQTVPLTIASRRPKWAKGAKGFEKANWVERNVKEYLGELLARQSVIKKEIWRNQVLLKKLNNELAGQKSRGTRMNEIRRQINKIVSVRDSRVERSKRGIEVKINGEVMESVPPYLNAIGDPSSKTASYDPKMTAAKVAKKYSNKRISKMMLDMENRYLRAFHDSQREFQDVFLTRKDLRTAFDEVGLFSRGRKNRPYVDMFTENSLVRYGKQKGNFNISEAFDTVFAPLKGEARARAKRIQPLVKYLFEKGHSPDVFLASMENPIAGAGMYDQINDQIVIDPTRISDDVENFDTLLEEFIHSVTFDVHKDKGINSRLTKLREQVTAELDKRGSDIDRYFLQDNREFIAHAISDPQVQELLSSIQVRDQGIIRTAFNRILELISEALGLDAARGSILEEVALHLSESVRKRATYSRRPRLNAEKVPIPLRSPEGYGKVYVNQFAGKTSGLVLTYSKNLYFANGSSFVLDKASKSSINENLVIEYSPEVWKAIRSDLALFAAAYHGSPRGERFDRFDTGFMGTGEGAQAFGWGLYFSTRQGVAGHYKNLRNREGFVEPKYMGETVDYEWTGPMEGAFYAGYDEPIVQAVLKDFDQTLKAKPVDSIYTQRESVMRDLLERIDYDRGLGIGMDAGLKEEFEEAFGLLLEPKQVRIHKEIGRIQSPEELGFADPNWLPEWYVLAESLHKFLELELPQKGQGYKVELAPAEDEYLLLDEPRVKQSEKVQQSLDNLENDLGELLPVNLNSGMQIYRTIEQLLAYKMRDEGDYQTKPAKATSLMLLKHGIRGNKFLDGASRSKGEGNYNYVIFDDSDIEITGSFARKRGARSGEEVLDIIKAKTEVPEESKTLVENSMSTWDKFKSAFVSSQHPWEVLQKVVDKTSLQGKTNLAHLAELQAGAAPKADWDVQVMERDVEGALGRASGMIDDEWSDFIILERIKSRLIDQQTKMGELEPRLRQFQDKSNWVLDEKGDPIEFDLRDDNQDFWVVDGIKKTRDELEMEYLRILGISKEVAPYKDWNSFKDDYYSGINFLKDKIADPEVLDMVNGEVTGKFVDAQEQYHSHMEGALMKLRQAGVLSPTLYNSIQRSTSFYVPFYVVRYFNRNPEDTFGQTIKGITDVGETIVKPMDAGRFKIYYSTLRAEKNEYIKKIDLWRNDFDPDGNHITRIIDPEDLSEGSGKGALMFYENGRKRYIGLDKRVTDVANRFTPVSASQAHRAMKVFGDIFKMGATGVNIFFQAFNFAMFDPIRLLTTSRAGMKNRDKGLNPWVLAQQYIRAMMAASWANLTPNSIKNLMSEKSPEFTQSLDNLYSEFINSGAAGSTIAEYFHKPDHIRDVLSGEKLSRKNPLTAVTAKLSQFGKTLEQTSKMVGMQRMMGFEEIEKLRSKMDKAKTSAAKVAIKNQIDEKMDFIATEIRNFAGSPDFLRQGEVTKNEALNILFLFFNARIQGVERDLSRLSKVFSGTSQEKGEALMVGMKISAFAVLPTIWAWSMNRRNEDREDDYDQISDEDKKNYIHIPLGEYFEHPYIEGKMVADYIRIPRRETFGLFSYTMEKALDWYYQKDPQAVSEMLGHWVEASMPVNVAGVTDGEVIKTGESVMSSLNPILKGPIEVLSNRNFFRHKPIVPPSLERADVSQQFFDKTPNIYRNVHFGLGALRMEHMVNGLTAGLLTQFTPPENTGIPNQDGTMPIGRTLSSTPLLSRLARSTFLKETELDEILNDENKLDATQRVMRRRVVDKFMTDTRGMTIQDRVRMLPVPRNSNEELVNMAVIRRLREMALGLEPDEIRLKNSSSAARASVVLKKMQGLQPAEVKVYLTDLASKKILTQDVANVLMEKMAMRGESMSDYITEPVR